MFLPSESKQERNEVLLLFDSVLQLTWLFFIFDRVTFSLIEYINDLF